MLFCASSLHLYRGRFSLYINVLSGARYRIQLIDVFLPFFVCFFLFFAFSVEAVEPVILEVKYMISYTFDKDVNYSRILEHVSHTAILITVFAFSMPFCAPFCSFTEYLPTRKLHFTNQWDR